MWPVSDPAYTNADENLRLFWPGPLIALDLVLTYVCGAAGSGNLGGPG